MYIGYYRWLHNLTSMAFSPRHLNQLAAVEVNIIGVEHSTEGSGLFTKAEVEGLRKVAQLILLLTMGK